jgi:hypothetical protein
MKVERLNVLNRFFINIIKCYAVLSWSFPVSLATDNLEANLLKAVYTYKFAKFVDWPKQRLNNTTPRFYYCILGQSDFSISTIELLNQYKVKNKALKVVHYETGIMPEVALQLCHLIFIAQSEQQRLNIILDSIRQYPILTVSDIPGFGRAGGMITLFNRLGGYLRFEINLKAAQHAHLDISSKLLRLSTQEDKQ